MMSVILPPGALRLALACIVVISHYAYLSGASLYAPIDGPAHYARAPRHDWAVWLAPVSLAAFLLFGVAPNIVRPSLSLDAISRFVVVLLSIISLPYIAAGLAKKSDEVDRTLGDLAYPVYLFHWPMFLIAAKVFPSDSVGAAIVLTAVVSVAVLWLVDRPLERWRRGIVSRRVVDAEGNYATRPSVPYIG